MIPPFNRSGDVDFDKLILHTDRLISNGVNYLVVLGTKARRGIAGALLGNTAEKLLHALTCDVMTVP